METTGGADEVKVIEGFVIRRPLASRAVTGTMSCSSTSSVVSRLESVASAAGSVPFLHPGSAALPRRTIQKTEWCTLIAILRLARSEEHTSELQSRADLVCRLLLGT